MLIYSYTRDFGGFQIIEQILFLFAVLEITVGLIPFSDQFEYLTNQNTFCSAKYFTYNFIFHKIMLPLSKLNCSELRSCTWIRFRIDL